MSVAASPPPPRQYHHRKPHETCETKPVEVTFNRNAPLTLTAFTANPKDAVETEIVFIEKCHEYRVKVTPPAVASASAETRVVQPPPQTDDPALNPQMLIVLVRLMPAPADASTPTQEAQEKTGNIRDAAARAGDTSVLAPNTWLSGSFPAS